MIINNPETKVPKDQKIDKTEMKIKLAVIGEQQTPPGSERNK